MINLWTLLLFHISFKWPRCQRYSRQGNLSLCKTTSEARYPSSQPTKSVKELNVKGLSYKQTFNWNFHLNTWMQTGNWHKTPRHITGTSLLTRSKSHYQNPTAIRLSSKATHRCKLPPFNVSKSWEFLLIGGCAAWPLQLVNATAMYLTSVQTQLCRYLLPQTFSLLCF